MHDNNVKRAGSQRSWKYSEQVLLTVWSVGKTFSVKLLDPIRIKVSRFGLPDVGTREIVSAAQR